MYQLSDKKEKHSNKIICILSAFSKYESCVKKRQLGFEVTEERYHEEPNEWSPLQKIKRLESLRDS